MAASRLPAAAGRFMRGCDGGLAGSVSRFRFPPFLGVGGGNVIGKRDLPVFAVEQRRRGFLALAGESVGVGMAVGKLTRTGTGWFPLVVPRNSRGLREPAARNRGASACRRALPVTVTINAWGFER